MEDVIKIITISKPFRAVCAALILGLLPSYLAYLGTLARESPPPSIEQVSHRAGSPPDLYFCFYCCFYCCFTFSHFTDCLLSSLYSVQCRIQLRLRLQASWIYGYATADSVLGASLATSVSAAGLDWLFLDFLLSSCRTFYHFHILSYSHGVEIINGK